jgi:hypothetical protein
MKYEFRVLKNEEILGLCFKSFRKKPGILLDSKQDRNGTISAVKL